jgi:hypothetical protein
MTSKRSGGKAKSGGGAKRGKAKVKRELKDLDVKKAKEIRGGDVMKGSYDGGQSAITGLKAS